MSRGLSVISSDRGSLPEVGGSAVVYVNPENYDDIALKMKSLSESKIDQQKYIQLGFENLKDFHGISILNNFQGRGEKWN